MIAWLCLCTYKNGLYSNQSMSCIMVRWSFILIFHQLNFLSHSISISDDEHVCWNMQRHHLFLTSFLVSNMKLWIVHFLEICDLFNLFYCIWYNHFNFLIWTIIGLLTISKVLSYYVSQIALLCRLPWMCPATWEDIIDRIRHARSSTIKR
jgi:hypothetical protein